MNSSLTNFNSSVHVINPSFSTSKIPSLFPFISVTKKGGRVFTLCKINKTAKDMDPGDPKFFGEARALGAVTDRSEVVRGGPALMLLFPPPADERKGLVWWNLMRMNGSVGCRVHLLKFLVVWWWCGSWRHWEIYTASDLFGTYSAEMHINSTPWTQ